MTQHNEPEELLAAMLELPAEEHDAFLDDQCGSDTALRADVDKLRQARGSPCDPADANTHDDAGSFVEELLGACSDELWQDPPGLPPTVAASRVSGTPPPSLGDRYEILRELGHGGMGTVYLAKDNKLKRKVALKMLPEVCIHQPRRRAMFEREACTAANLSHANVATVYEFEEFEGKPYIAMEYVEGRPLRQVLAEERPLPLSKLLDFAQQMTEGLHAAHRQSIIHRDLKPGNVMVTEEGVVKILDFGLAKALQTGEWDGAADGGPETVGSSGVLLGTPGYMSPEQARRNVDVDGRTDLFSLGIVLYEMATGSGPFHRETPEECISAALNDTPQPVAALNSGLPPAVADVINKLLVKDRDARYQSAEQVLKDLRRLAASHEAEKWRMRLRSRGVVKKRGQRKWWVAAVVGVLIVGAVILKDTIWPTTPDLGVFRQINARWDNGAFQEAFALLREQEKRFGKDHPVLAPLRITLETGLVKLHGEECDNLAQFLADGHDERTAVLASRIKVLEDLCVAEAVSRGKDSRTGAELIKKAGEMRRQIVEARRRAQAFIEQDHWRDALDASQQLEKETFEDKPFQPAQQEATSLMAEIAKAICAQKHIDPDEVEESIGVLEKINPGHPRLSGLRATRTRLRNQRRLETLHRSVGPESSLEEIRKALAKMGDIDLKREHQLTKDLERLYRTRAKEQRVAATKARIQSGAQNAFSDRSETVLAVVIESAEEDGNLDGKDLEALKAALKWLRELNTALGSGVAELEGAKKARRVLQQTREKLPDYLRAKAGEHLVDVGVHIKRCDNIASANQLYSDVVRACKTRQLAEARSKLAQLQQKDLAELAPMKEGATRHVHDLAVALQEEADLEKRFEGMLASLHAREFGRAQASLAALQHGWRKVQERLDVAIEASAGERKAELLLQRSKLSLKLGLPVAAAEDAHRAHELLRDQGPKLGAQLVHAQAEFAQWKSKHELEHVSAALARFQTLGNDARVLYWKGVCRHDAKHYEQARQDLEAALRAGLDSGDVHGWLSRTCFLMKKDYGKALEHANRAFQKPWTEDDLIAVFGRVPSAQQARQEWRNALYNRACIHARLEQWRECARDCEASLAMDSAYRKARELLDFAESKLKKQP